MALVECPECTEVVSSEAPACPHCGITTAAHIHAAPAAKSIWTRRLAFGDLLVVGGIGTLLYYYACFDTSVEVPKQVILGQVIGGMRVNNLGLMSDRQNGILIGLALIVFGLILGAIRRRNAR